MLPDTKWKKFRKNYLVLPLIISLIIFGFLFYTSFFMPNFIFSDSKKTYWSYLFSTDMFFSGDTWLSTATILSIVLWFISNILLIISLFCFIRAFICFVTYPRWIKQYCNYCSEIINCTHLEPNKLRVCAIVYVCNDLAPATILQSMNQTYKNFDVWILDDSSKPECIAQVDKFCKENGYYVLHRDPIHKKNHPSMVGNLHYFLDRHANEYDYIFESGSSSIVTSTFIENCLKFFIHNKKHGETIGAVSSNGSFYPSNSLFGYIAGKGTQWGDANINGVGFRTSGTQCYVNGWGALYNVEVLKSIPLKSVEATCCDAARSFWMAQHGIRTCLNPFDFTGKLVTQNIYRFKNQRMKWAGGDAFNFKHLFARKHKEWRSNLFINLQFISIIFVPLGLMFGLFNMLLTCFCPQLSWSNLSSTIFTVSGAILLAVVAVVSILVNKASFKIVIISIFNGMFEYALTFRRFYKLFFYGMILGKWSAKAVTIKTTEKLSKSQWFKICLADMIVIIITVILCLILTFFSPLDKFGIWTTLFFFVTGPSWCWILSSFLSFIPVKSGWHSKLQYFNIAKNDYRFKYIKETDIWKKQHPNNK